MEIIKMNITPPWGGRALKGLYILAPSGGLLPYRVSSSGSTWYPYLDETEATKLAEHLRLPLYRLESDLIHERA